MRRRRRKIAAAAAAVILAPAIASGEPAAIGSPSNLSALDDVGRGLVGLTDPDDVSADGDLSDNDQIGVDLLRDAGNPDALKQQGLDLPVGPLGIPGVILQAYQRAADSVNKLQPNCHMDWALLASIGRIESNHARGGQVYPNGDTVQNILGPVLNGGGFAAIADSDGGVFDGDNRWDRAVGLMQFIPSTWRQYASDGNGDRRMSPHNVFDATLAAAKYLCSGGLDMANPQQRAVAVFRYNHSDSYVRTVLVWADAYAKGVTPLPSESVPALQQAIGPVVDPVTGVPQPPPTNQVPPPDSSTTTTTTTTSTTTTTTTTTTEPPRNCETTSTSPPSSTTTTPPQDCTTTTTSTTTSTSSQPPPDTGTGGGGTGGGTTSTQSQTSTQAESSSSAAITTTTVAPPPAESSSSSLASSEVTSPVGP